VALLTTPFALGKLTSSPTVPHNLQIPLTIHLGPSWKLYGAVLAHSKRFDSPTRNTPVAEFIDSFRERGQRDGMKRENYLPIIFCGRKICHHNHHLEKAPCAARPERRRRRPRIRRKVWTPMSVRAISIASAPATRPFSALALRAGACTQARRLAQWCAVQGLGFTGRKLTDADDGDRQRSTSSPRCLPMGCRRSRRPVPRPSHRI